MTRLRTSPRASVQLARVQTKVYLCGALAGIPQAKSNAVLKGRPWRPPEEEETRVKLATIALAAGLAATAAEADDCNNVRASVEKEVEKLLPQGKANVQIVAKALALSVRTLSRRLADEGTTYAEVVDELRRSLAVQYLREPVMSLSQIAWLLGYEGTTSFNYAFRRWTGRSPSATRNEKLLSAPA